MEIALEVLIWGDGTSQQEKLAHQTLMSAAKQYSIAKASDLILTFKDFARHLIACRQIIFTPLPDFHVQCAPVQAEDPASRLESACLRHLGATLRAARELTLPVAELARLARAARASRAAAIGSEPCSPSHADSGDARAKCFQDERESE